MLLGIVHTYHIETFSIRDTIAVNIKLTTSSFKWSNYDSLWAHGRVIQSILGLREVVTAENWCPIPHLTVFGPEVWSVGRWRSWYDRVSRMPAYQTCLRAKLESDLTDGGWYLTTALPSSRDRSQSLCVLRRSGSESKTGWTGEW